MSALAMGLPPAWEQLRRAVNGLPGLYLGEVGIRDPEATCKAVDGVGYDGHGECHSDGHYLCLECSHLSPVAPRFTEYGESNGAEDRRRALAVGAAVRRRRAGAP